MHVNQNLRYVAIKHCLYSVVNEGEGFTSDPQPPHLLVLPRPWNEHRLLFRDQIMAGQKHHTMKNSTKSPFCSQFPKIAAVCFCPYTLLDRLTKSLHMKQTVHSADLRKIQSNWIKMWHWRRYLKKKQKKLVSSACRQVWRSCPEGVLGLHPEDSWW